jgi:hypothetical protein
MAEIKNVPVKIRVDRRTIWSPRTRRIARDTIAEAALLLGGGQRLFEWAKEDPKNEAVFWGRIYPKLVSIDVKVETGKRLSRALTWLPPT